MHVPAPEQSPDQPVNVDPAAGAAVSVTSVPSAKLFEHVAPQLIPLGLDVTVPVPVPAFVTVKSCGEPKLAKTPRAPFIVTVHVPVPVQSPLQPRKFEPPLGVAVSVTIVPSAKFALQVGSQLMPAGLEATLPTPFPPTPTSSG